MIRQGRWKFVHNAKAPHQLFDLELVEERLEELTLAPENRREVFHRHGAALRAVILVNGLRVSARCGAVGTVRPEGDAAHIGPPYSPLSGF